MGRWLMLTLVTGVLSLLAACGGGGGSPASGIQPGGINYPAANAAMGLFNTYRARSLVPPVALDIEDSAACQAHADYLNLNNISLGQVGLAAHQETPGLPGYSNIGAQAGSRSVIYEGVTAEKAIENWMNTFYHRLGLLNPNLATIGFGSADEYQVMDIISGLDHHGATISTAVLFPPPGATDIPGRFKKEIPNPIPGDDSMGVPITVEFFGEMGRQVHIDLAILDDLTTGKQVICYVQTPASPFLAEWSYHNVVALLPVDPLPSGHTFRVNITGIVDHLPWQANWDFST